MMLDEVRVHFDLLGELLAGVEKSERMVVSFGEELYGAGVGEGVKSAHDLRGILFELFNDDPSAGIGDLELSGVLSDEVEDKLIGGQIALFGYFVDNLLVVVVVEVIGVRVEDGVASEPIGLVNLEIETN